MRPASTRVVSQSTATSRMNLKAGWPRSEEHTSELQSQSNLVCRLLLEKKNCLLIDERLPTRVADLRLVLSQVHPEHLLTDLSSMHLSLATCRPSYHRLTT